MRGPCEYAPWLRCRGGADDVIEGRVVAGLGAAVGAPVCGDPAADCVVEPGRDQTGRRLPRTERIGRAQRTEVAVDGADPCPPDPVTLAALLAARGEGA